MANPPDKKIMGVVMSIDKLNKIYAMADEYGINRSEFIRRLINMGFEDALLLDRTGILPIIKHGRTLLDKFKVALKNDKVDVSKDGVVSFSL